MIVAPDDYRRAEALRHEAATIYAQNLAAARAEKAAQWPERRAELMRRWVISKRDLEERGEPFIMPEPPPLACPEFFLADVTVPDVPVRVPQPGEGEAGAVIAPGRDLLGRPSERPLTPEEQFARAREGVGAKIKRAAGWS